MKHRLITVFFTLVSVCFIAQTTSISGVINIYTSVNSVSQQSIVVSSAAGFSITNQVLIIQMKGVSIVTTNNSNYGTVTSYNDAGNYEFAVVSSISGNTIVLNAPLNRTYSNTGPIQLVKVPVYNNALVTGVVSCPAWNGSTGGVLAMVVCGNLTLNSGITASERGFRGSAVITGSQSCVGDSNNYVLSSPNLMSSLKGEGIFVTNSSNEMSRGKSANGGGGANNVNGGGAGGSNYGFGGRGGDFQSPYTCPSGYQLFCGGIGGQALNYSNSVNKIFMGGAGGTGHDNNGTSPSGGNGGGIIIIKAANIVGNNQTISADGADITQINCIDGQGGGGAGGTVLLDIGSASFLNVTAKGGFGGSDNYSGWDCHGKGGGGGGGILWIPGTLGGITSVLSGGNPGTFVASTSPCSGNSLGATQGGNGMVMNGLLLQGRLRTCESVGVQEADLWQSAFTIYPNPSQGAFLLEMQGFEQNVITELKVVDVLGRLVYSENFVVTGFKHSRQLMLNQLSLGTYFLSIGNENLSRHAKVVIDR